MNLTLQITQSADGRWIWIIRHGDTIVRQSDTDAIPLVLPSFLNRMDAEFYGDWALQNILAFYALYPHAANHWLRASVEFGPVAPSR